VFGKGVLRVIIISERAEFILGWRKLHNEEPFNLYFRKYNYNDKLKEDNMGRTCSTHEEKRISFPYGNFVGKPRRKRLLERHTRR
jgi:hypothetical protein